MGSELIADEKIREAMEAGAFDGLAGDGKPIATADDSLAGDNRMAFSILRSNGFLPEWLELRKDIHQERDAVRAALETWADAIERHGSARHAVAVRCAENYRRAATAINAKIDLHNLRCPSIMLEIARFREDAKPPNYSIGTGSSEL